MTRRLLSLTERSPNPSASHFLSESLKTMFFESPDVGNGNGTHGRPAHRHSCRRSLAWRLFRNLLGGLPGSIFSLNVSFSSVSATESIDLKSWSDGRARSMILPFASTLPVSAVSTKKL